MAEHPRISALYRRSIRRRPGSCSATLTIFPQSSTMFRSRRTSRRFSFSAPGRARIVQGPFFKRNNPALNKLLDCGIWLFATTGKPAQADQQNRPASRRNNFSTMAVRRAFLNPEDATRPSFSVECLRRNEHPSQELLGGQTVILIRNITSAFQRLPLLAGVLVLSGSLAISTPLLAQQVQSKDCGKVIGNKRINCYPGTPPVLGRGTPYPPFNDMKKIVLVVNIPPKYKQAIECHGKEDQCVHDNPMHGTPVFDDAKALHKLKNDYKTFPVPLRTEYLVKVFSELINLQYYALGESGSERQSPQLVVIDRQPGAWRNQSTRHINGHDHTISRLSLTTRYRRVS